MYKIRGTDGKEYGPASAEQMRQWLAENRINAGTLVQVEGSSDWQPLSALPEFATEAAAAPAPAAAPLAAPFPAADTRSAVLAKVKGPAIALMVVAIFFLLLGAASLILSLAGVAIGASRSTGNPDIDRMMTMMQGGVGVLSNAIGLFVSGFILFAATKMKKLENYGMVLTATILVMVPCISPCCFIGLPFGIWALVVLNQPDVKGAFE
jgi:hypothetical protein